jgi:hypothetical protein
MPTILQNAQAILLFVGFFFGGLALVERRK